MEFHTRKKLRLDGYDYGSPGAYFVTVCTQNRKTVLGTIVGADDHIGPNLHETTSVGADDHIGPHIRLSKIGSVVEKYTRTIPGIDRYVIMPNHVHMILRISAKNPLEGPMWPSAPTNIKVENLVRSWKVLISKELGESIWQRSFYDHIIRDEREYIEKAQYMLNNPAKWCEDKYYPGY